MLDEQRPRAWDTGQTEALAIIQASQGARLVANRHFGNTWLLALQRQGATRIIVWDGDGRMELTSDQGIDL